MGGRGQTSGTLTRRSGESLLAFKRRQRLARSGQSSSYSGGSFRNSDGVEGRTIITSKIDSRGRPTQTVDYQLNGKSVSKREYDNHNNNWGYHSTGSTTSDRSVKRRKSRMEQWMGIR